MKMPKRGKGGKTKEVGIIQFPNTTILDFNNNFKFSILLKAIMELELTWALQLCESIVAKTVWLNYLQPLRMHLDAMRKNWMVPTKGPASRSSIPEPTTTEAGSLFDQTLVWMVDDLWKKL